MTSKSFHVEKKLRITDNMEKSVTKAFQEFAKHTKNAQPTPRQFNGILRRSPSPNACKHSWKQLSSIPKEHSDYLKLVTEEEPVPGSTKWCANCGSVSYWEGGQLWLFDSTTRYFGKPPKRRRHERNAEDQY